jgi:hypothetical protein
MSFYKLIIVFCVIRKEVDGLWGRGERGREGES